MSIFFVRSWGDALVTSIGTLPGTSDEDDPMTKSSSRHGDCDRSHSQDLRSISTVLSHAVGRPGCQEEAVEKTSSDRDRVPMCPKRWSVCIVSFL
jgi:hypothetical protein